MTKIVITNYLVTIKCLAVAHDLTQETLLRDFIWIKLVRRTFPPSSRGARAHVGVGPCDHWNLEPVEEEMLMPTEVERARVLAQILKKAGKPKSLQLELLHVICQQFPPAAEDLCSFGIPLVRLRCPCNQRHRVAALGFLLLEEVEATLGSTAQIMDLAQANLSQEPLMIALRNRELRQHGVQGVLVTDTIRCNNLKSAEAVFTLMELCQKIYFEKIEVKKVIKAEGWAMLRQAFELLPKRRDLDRNYSLVSSRESLQHFKWQIPERGVEDSGSNT